MKPVPAGAVITWRPCSSVVIEYPESAAIAAWGAKIRHAVEIDPAKAAVAFPWLKATLDSVEHQEFL